MNTLLKSEKDRAAVLLILSEIAERDDITQRHIADRLGVALGLANSYLKRCVTKGFIKIKQAPANRYLYYLTPKGFSEKSRLTSQYLRISFEFYRKASTDLEEVIEECEAAGVSTVLFIGATELAEICSVRLNESQLRLVGTYANGPEYQACGQSTFLGQPVWSEIGDLPCVDAWIFTSLTPVPKTIREIAVTNSNSGRLYVPELVKGLTPMPGVKNNKI